MGIGRTGLFAIVLLMALGIPRIEAEQIIRNAHALYKPVPKLNLSDGLNTSFKTRHNQGILTRNQGFMIFSAEDISSFRE
jgi:hypothetical protein